MHFGISPIAGTILAKILIVWLIGSGVKSAGKKIFESPVEHITEEDLRRIKAELGPISWKEHLIGILGISVFLSLYVAFIIWITG